MIDIYKNMLIFMPSIFLIKKIKENTTLMIKILISVKESEIFLTWFTP